MRPFSRNALLILLCATGLGLVLAACGGSSQQTIKVTGTGHRTQLTSILQADGLMYGEPAVVFADARKLGIQVIRFNAMWTSYVRSDNARTKPAGFDATDPGSSGYDWADLDLIVRASAGTGVKLDLTLMGGAPRWATGSGRPSRVKNGQWKVSAADFAQFVTAVGKRYSGHYIPKGSSKPLPRVSFWSIWNEPNYVPYIAPQAEDTTLNGTKVVVDLAAPQYRKLLNAGWNALSATGHSTKTDTILIGETAPAGVSNPAAGDGMTPSQQFIRDLYCVSNSFKPLTGTAATDEGCPSGGSSATFAADNPALFEASGWAVHPYTYVVSPAEKLPGGSDPVANEWGDFGRLPEVADTLDQSAGAWGEHPKLVLYNTEYGYFADPPTPKSNIDAEPDATVAAWLNEAEYLSWKDPRIASYDQYLLQDPTPGPAGSQFDSGIETYTGAPIADVYDAFRLPMWLPSTSAKKGSPVDVWGCARPLADDATLSHTVDIQFAATGTDFHTVKQVTVDPSSDGCYFNSTATFPSSGTVRLVYRDGSSTLISRTQAITIQ